MLEFIRSVLIDTDTCTWVWLKFVCGIYPNWTYRFSPPTGLWKVVVRGTVVCNWLLTSINCFEWSKTSLKLFTKPSFVDCWLLYIEFTGSLFIDPKTCPWVWLQIFCGKHLNRTYGLSSPVYLWKVMERVPVVWDHF